MELSHQQTLLEELIMGPPFYGECFPFPATTGWEFQQGSDLHFSGPNTSLLDLISPPELNYPCTTFDEFHFQPFLDVLTNSAAISSYNAAVDLPGMLVQGDQYAAMDDGQAGPFDVSAAFEDQAGSYKAESSAQNDGAAVWEKKSRTKKPDGQPSKNLMAERRRRKRLNDRLSMLRSIVPKISKMDRTSILGDTIDYMRELLDKIHKLKEEGLDGADDGQISPAGLNYLREVKPNEMLARNPAKFDVERRNRDTRVEVCCTTKPGLLLSTLGTLDALGLDIHHCVISCFNDFSLQASCLEGGENETLLSCEDIKQALYRNAGYGGRCM